MPRAPFQVLVIPFRRTPEGIRYALFKRHLIEMVDLKLDGTGNAPLEQLNAGFWQPVAGGGEDNETPEEAARREAFEEAGIHGDLRLIRLDTVSSIPVVHFPDRDHWGPEIHVIPEYSFGIEVENEEISLCDEHTEYQWLNYSDAYARVRFDSNRTALWELNRRLEIRS